MKPAVCSMCGKAASEESTGHNGEWLEFDDYNLDDINSLSHPQGLEYFCSDHYVQAGELTGITASSALAQLGRVERVVREEKSDPSVFRRLINKLSR